MEEAYQYLLKSKLIQEGTSVVVGVSGGPDSMVLLSLMLKLKKVVPFQIVCAHVHHNIRKESDDEYQFVASFCQKNGIVFEGMKIETYHDENFHQQARKIRYDFFENLVNKYHASYLMTAHHGDDLMETMLMRMTRGSTMKGYSGFELCSVRANYQIMRPLIFATKSEILEYARRNEIPYVIDASNEKEDYTRNRYRKHVLPFLKQENAEVHQKFYKFSRMLSEYQSYIASEVSQKWDHLVKDHKLFLPNWKEESPLIQRVVMERMLELVYHQDLLVVSSVHVDAIMGLCHSSKGNGSLNLPNHIQVVKAYDFLSFQKDTNENESYEYELVDFVKLSSGKTISFVSYADLDNNDVCRLSKSEVVFPLFVRSRKVGDKISVKGLSGRKKISDILIDSKVPLQERTVYPIVVDSKGTIVWIPGLKKSKFDRTKEEKYDIILTYQ